MSLDSFIDSSFHHLPEPSFRNSTEYYSAGNQGEPNNVQYRSYAPFRNAREFVIQNATMIERAEYSYSVGRSALELLHPYTNPDAAMDSSARDPPPKCHPGTRIDIMEQLDRWLESPSRGYEMWWLYGPAGTGKSAIAQTFAEICAEKDHLGATFFFSRPNHRDKPEAMIPSLAYQLAFHCSAYKSLIAQILADDPQLLRKAIRVQFKRLIVEPFSRLQTQGHESARQPYLVLLDGLDECAGARPQWEFIKMISELVRLKRGFPILWLLCSRPESHLKHVFSRTPECGRLELLLDEGSRDDVELFLRDSFAAIKDDNPDIVPLSWPPEDQLSMILRVASGLFVVASVAVRYVDDPAAKVANPIQRLNALVAYLAHSETVGAKNPLAALDLIYLSILHDVPSEVLPVTRRILVHLVFNYPREVKTDGGHLLSTQATCNMLQFNQSTFYSALRCLHSVLEVPSPEDAIEKQLRFYHASFHDFLLDHSRSGSFALTSNEVFVTEFRTYMLWHQSDHSAHYHDVQRQQRLGKGLNSHQVGTNPGFTWALVGDRERISLEIADFIVSNVWFAFGNEFALSEQSEDLLVQIKEYDFRRTASHGIPLLAEWIGLHYPSCDLVRTEPTGEVDSCLLGYLQFFNTVPNYEPVRPATLPVKYHYWSQKRDQNLYREYFLLGHGPNTCLVLRTIKNEPSGWDLRADLLSIDWPPSDEFLAEHHRWFESRSRERE